MTKRMFSGSLIKPTCFREKLKKSALLRAFLSLSRAFSCFSSLLTILTLPATTLTDTGKTESDYFSVFPSWCSRAGNDEWGRLNRILASRKVQKVQKRTLSALSGAH